jgi:hypothetical protein
MMQSDHDAKLIDAEYERARDAGELDERFAAEASARRRTAPVSPGTGENMSKAQTWTKKELCQAAGIDGATFDEIADAAGVDVPANERGDVPLDWHAIAMQLHEDVRQLVEQRAALLAACEESLRLMDAMAGLGGPFHPNDFAGNKLRAAIAAAREGSKVE